MKKINKKDYWEVEDKGLKTSELIELMRKEFTVYFYGEENIDKNFPVPRENTVRYFHKTEESDSEWKGKSRNDMEGKPLMTLREYIILFMAYHKETGKYLDEKGWTIFSDRLSSGEVASGRWRPIRREVSFIWGGADLRDSSSGARVAISLDSSSSNPSLSDAMKQVRDAGYLISKPI